MQAEPYTTPSPVLTMDPRAQQQQFPTEHRPGDTAFFLPDH